MTAAAQACLSLALFAAYGAMSVALVLAVYFSYPLLVCGASIALGRERLTPVRALALVVSLAGLLIVVLGRLGPGAHASPTGLALAGIAACCQATYLVASRNGFTRVPSTQAVTVILVGAALGIWVVALPVDGGAGRLLAWIGDPEAWLAVLFAGAVGAGLAKVWLLRGVRRVGGTRSSVLMLVEPVTGVVLAALLLGQPFGAPEIAGRGGDPRRRDARPAARDPGAPGGLIRRSGPGGRRRSLTWVARGVEPGYLLAEPRGQPPRRSQITIATRKRRISETP